MFLEVPVKASNNAEDSFTSVNSSRSAHILEMNQIYQEAELQDALETTNALID